MGEHIRAPVIDSQAYGKAFRLMGSLASMGPFSKWLAVVCLRTFRQE